MINQTSIKTKLGDVLELLSFYALEEAGYTFHHDWQYESNCIKVDFAIIENDKPKVFLEVTQTENRQSFRMKLLRYFELVSQVKTFFLNGHLKTLH